MIYPQKLIDRFFSKVLIIPEEPCWLWMASKNKKGYGNFGIGRSKAFAAHRVAWEIYNNQKVPEGMVVMHSCDRPSCVRKEHLSVGTVKDNVLDAKSKGRLAHQKMTHCKNGHPLFGDNVRIVKRYDGSGAVRRLCRICRSKIKMNNYNKPKNKKAQSLRLKKKYANDPEFRERAKLRSRASYRRKKQRTSTQG